MTTFKGTLLATSLVASAAMAQDSAPHVAPEEVRRISPALAQYTDEVLFGEVWRGDSLAPRDRSLITIAALVALGKTPQIAAHASRGLDNGLTPEEISEILVQLAFYSGWPNAVSAATELDTLFHERGIAPVQPSSGEPIELDPESEATRQETVAETVEPFVPGLAADTNRVLFGDLWRRPQLSPRDRSLVTMAGLIAMGQAEQLTYHLNRAMDNGLTPEEAGGVVSHLAYYAGWPRAFSAVPVVRDVLQTRSGADAAASDEASAKGLRIQRAAEAGVSEGDPANFTGRVRIESFFSAPEPAATGSALVHFEPGARTAWHTHPLGQTLTIASGCGWVQSEGGEVRTVRTGDVVWIPPHVRHWHGASADTGMSHFAVAEAQDGSATEWMEHVADEAYSAGNSCD